MWEKSVMLWSKFGDGRDRGSCGLDLSVELFKGEFVWFL